MRNNRRGCILTGWSIDAPTPIPLTDTPVSLGVSLPVPTCPGREWVARQKTVFTGNYDHHQMSFETIQTNNSTDSVIIPVPLCLPMVLYMK